MAVPSHDPRRLSGAKPTKTSACEAQIGLALPVLGRETLSALPSRSGLAMKASQILLNFTDLNSARPLSGVYVLCGARARRITAVAQQHRAISLVEALLKDGKLKRGTTIGIVGGGIAGCTAAYWAVCNGAAVTLYEKGPQLLDVYSKASHRYLHPGLFNWPHPGWDIQHTNLPCLNWSFNTAQHVGNLLRGKMEELRLGVGNALLDIKPDALCHLQWEPASHQLLSIVRTDGSQRTHHVVIVAVGEGDYDEGGPGYWDAVADRDLFDKLRNRAFTKAVVIGNGDGGIMEVLRMKTPIADEDALVKCLASWKDAAPDSMAAVEAYFKQHETGGGASTINADGIQSAWGTEGDRFLKGFMGDANNELQAWRESLEIDWYSRQAKYAGVAAPLLKLLLAAQEKFSGKNVQFFRKEHDLAPGSTPSHVVVLRRVRGQPPLARMDGEREKRTGDAGGRTLVTHAEARSGINEGDFFAHWYLFKSASDLEAISITPDMRRSPAILPEAFKANLKLRCLEVAIPPLPMAQWPTQQAHQRLANSQAKLLEVYTPLKIRESKAIAGGRGKDTSKEATSAAGHSMESPAMDFTEACSRAKDKPFRRVLMGAGGRGKSTLTQFLTYSLLCNDDEVNALVDEELRAEVVKLRNVWHETVPVMVRLRDLPVQVIKQIRSAEDLVLASMFRTCMGWSLDGREADSKTRGRLVFESFREDTLALMQGKRLLILDGMDEIPPDAQLMIAKLLRHDGANDGNLASWDIVVTARTASVNRGAVNGWYANLGWLAWEVQPLSDDAIGNANSQQFMFALRYLKVLSHGSNEVAGLARGLLGEVGQRRITDIVREPLLFGALARVYLKSMTPRVAGEPDSSPKLPGTKAEVLHAVMNLLIEEWDDSRGVQHRIKLLLSDARLPAEVPKRVLGEIAARCLLEKRDDDQALVFPQHGQGGSLAEGLWVEFSNVGTALPTSDSVAMAEAFAERIGILRIFSSGSSPFACSLEFTHAMYASCLAGLYWAAETGRFESALQSMTQNAKSLASDHVRQAVALGLAGLKLDLDKPAGQRQPSMARVFPLLEALEQRARQATDNEVRRGLYDTLGDAIKELGIDATDLSPEEARSRERLEGELHNVFASGAEPLRTRLKVGRALGWIGDGRPEVVAYSKLDRAARMLWSSPIMPRSFDMGSQPGKGVYADEQPQFPCNLVRREFRLGRFPVTVQQFREFERVGYQPEALVKYWTVHGREFAEGTRKPDYSLIRDEKNRKAYQNWVESDRYPLTGHRVIEGDFETPNAPVVGVSWYEAVAFCNWLNDAYKGRLGLPEGWQVRLPTEAEWELAASYRDGKKCLYPWGIDTDVAGRANCNEAGKFTSAVGSFGEMGRAECGAEDMIGNVWEWCSTGWTDDYKGYEQQEHVRDELVPGGRAREILDQEMLRVIRGGSWWNKADVCRASYRLRYRPENRNDDVGFRLAASPISGLW